MRLFRKSNYVHYKLCTIDVRLFQLEALSNIGTVRTTQKHNKEGNSESVFLSYKNEKLHQHYFQKH